MVGLTHSWNPDPLEVSPDTTLKSDICAVPTHTYCRKCKLSKQMMYYLSGLQEVVARTETSKGKGDSR